MLLDDNINAESTRFPKLVAALAEEGVPWDAVNGFRADRLDRQTIRGIAAAGNTKITVSAESGDPLVLRRSIKKGLKLSSVVKVAKLCEEEGIPLQVHYILGVPGETKAQVNKTLELATELFVGRLRRVCGGHRGTGRHTDPDQPTPVPSRRLHVSLLR